MGNNNQDWDDCLKMIMVLKDVYDKEVNVW